MSIGEPLLRSLDNLDRPAWVGDSVVTEGAAAEDSVAFPCHDLPGWVKEHDPKHVLASGIPRRPDHASRMPVVDDTDAIRLVPYQDSPDTRLFTDCLRSRIGLDGH